MADGRCECAVGHPDRAKGRCGGETSDPKFVICRPCAKGNHSRQPCALYVPEPRPAHLMRTCRACGVDSAKHPIPAGSFGGRA